MSGRGGQATEPGDGTSLAARLAARIARLGPMTVAEYMTVALTDPRHGYYMTDDPLGARGDFITAPEISQMFGELIGLWCAAAWARLGQPDPVLLVELGPGRGTLLRDALRAARTVPSFRRAVRLHLVEVSPVLRQRQAATLAATGVAEPAWHDSLGDAPEGPLILIANEFFDALPVRQFARTEAGWCERMVALAEDGRTLAFALAPPHGAVELLLPGHLRAAPPGAVVEVSPAAIGIAGDIGRRLSAHGGVALIIDYGGTEMLGTPTLQAVRGHGRHDVLAEPGTADLTAHVDFTALAQAAGDTGARAHGPVGQGEFLRALGLAERAEALQLGATPAQALDIAGAARRLADPADMGTLFKVLALTAPEVDDLPGFSPPVRLG